MTITPQTTDTGARAPRTGHVVDPLGELAFKVDIPGRAIGRFAECTGLAVEYDVMEYAEGGNNDYVHHLRGRVRYPNVVLRRGVTFEDALLRWFYAVEKPSQRPNLTITLLSPKGDTIRHFALKAALPVKWTGPIATMKGAPEAATESLEIAHQGFV
jgi:phage tail-like protein